LKAEEKQISELRNILDPLPLGGWRYHPVVGSTNDLALEWAEKAAADWSLVLGDDQTAGRGRGSRRWEMAPGKGLAMSLILRPTEAEKAIITRFTALAALGLVHALRKYDLEAAIKWPNDVLLQGKKVGGVLVETVWVGDLIEACVIGMGVNVAKDCVPKSADLHLPATSVEAAVGVPVSRWELLVGILKSMITLRPIITTDAFIDEWNQHLAFRDAWVDFNFSTGVVESVKVLRIDGDGKLTLRHADDRVEGVNSGEIFMENKTS